MISKSLCPRKSIRGVIIYPPNQLMDVETPRPDGSLGPLYLASSLEKKGIKTDILDASVGWENQSLQDTFDRIIRQENGLVRIGMNFEEIANSVSQRGYDFVGINSNFTCQTRMAIETARAIRNASPNIRVYTGGINARALRERFLATGYFDGVCLTEGELSFPKMVEAHFKGKTVEGVAGVAFVYNGKTKENPVDETCFPRSLDDLPMPAWEKLPFDKYEKISSPHGVDVTGTNYRYAPQMTSRGCRFQCVYCHISQEKGRGISGLIGRIRTHSVDRVIEETETLKKLGVEKIYLEDDSLLAGKKRMYEIFGILKDRGLAVANVNGVNLIDFFEKRKNGRWTIDYEFIQLLRNGGFEQMVFPAESGCQRILDRYASGKVNLDRMDLSKLMREITASGIKAPVNMMLGFPDETEQEMQQSIDLSKRLMDSGAPYVTFFIPIPFPGSKLFDIAINEGYLEGEFDPDRFNWKNPVMRNTTVPPAKLENIIDHANTHVNTKEHVQRRLKQSMAHRVASEK